MKYNPEKHHRRSIRLKDFDYSQTGVYFVTVCAYNRECLFGDIVNDEMILSEYGKIVDIEWKRSEKIRSEIKLDVYQIMPNHFHNIVWIFKNSFENVGANSRSPQPNDSLPKFRMKPKSLSSLMAGFESSVTTKINRLRGTPGMPVLQRNYYDHIIRNDDDLNRIRQYIINNPRDWKSDNENPNNIP